MTTIKVTENTSATPEQFLAALIDFGPHRSEIWRNSAASFLKVHDQGPTSADVTEGSVGIWERLHYDWSNPHDIVLTTTDSNTWGHNSGHRYTLTPNADGTTKLDMVLIREGISVKGRVVAALLTVVGKPAVAKALRTTLRAIEARQPA